VVLNVHAIQFQLVVGEVVFAGIVYAARVSAGMNTSFLPTETNEAFTINDTHIRDIGDHARIGIW
jgi:hypothetical protein